MQLLVNLVPQASQQPFGKQNVPIVLLESTAKVAVLAYLVQLGNTQRLETLHAQFVRQAPLLVRGLLSVSLAPLDWQHSPVA